MDEKALLEAIGQMMDAKLAQQKTEILDEVDGKLTGVEQRLDTKLAEAEQRIAKNTVTLMDAEFSSHFNLLAEGQEDILRRMPSEEDMDIIDGRLDILEAVVKKHSREIQELKKAN